ncbi:Reticulon-like protein B1 [Acorus calamus]|uniref:Reticulon-like protein n=1 Tax=Acorus calamus TaxID=4465 RepID=A0AAV9F5K8_ACOCL|nr:Reticulon-like protein B1 [Acorus calamus]
MIFFRLGTAGLASTSAAFGKGCTRGCVFASEEMLNFARDTNMPGPGLIFSDSDNDQPSHAKSLFGRERPLHNVLGGGRVADVILWRNVHLSAGILAAVTVLWFLFEVVEYHFVTLLCHALITIMLVTFILYNGAALIDRTPPKIPQSILSEHTFRKVALTFHAKLSFLCIFTLPVLYERYEHDVDYLANRGNRDLKKMYRKLDSKVLNKIPRGPVKKDKKNK